MRLAFYTMTISPHQLPLARELVKRLGAENFLYICHQPLSAERSKLGWSNHDEASWILPVGADEAKRQDWLERAEVLFTYIRDLDLIERRSRSGLKTIYCGERWLKPLDISLGIILFGRLWERYSGRVRMLIPSFRRMVARMRQLALADANFTLFPIGVYARADFAWLGVPDTKMTTWGYFVAPTTHSNTQTLKHSNNVLRVLWVGRMLKLKNVDTIIKAVQRLDPKLFSLTLVGSGPCEMSLKRLAAGMSNVAFKPPVTIEKVRLLMREHDVYVFPSNGFDGWGAVVSEALEEGMVVLGSHQAGATATILPSSHRFNCRDARVLGDLLRRVATGAVSCIPIGHWNAQSAAERLVLECV